LSRADVNVDPLRSTRMTRCPPPSMDAFWSKFVYVSNS